MDCQIWQLGKLYQAFHLLDNKLWGLDAQCYELNGRVFRAIIKYAGGSDDADNSVVLMIDWPSSTAQLAHRDRFGIIRALANVSCGFLLWRWSCLNKLESAFKPRGSWILT